jgi:hypothetical protein
MSIGQAIPDVSTTIASGITVTTRTDELVIRVPVGGGQKRCDIYESLRFLGPDGETKGTPVLNHLASRVVDADLASQQFPADTVVSLGTADAPLNVDISNLPYALMFAMVAAFMRAQNALDHDMLVAKAFPQAVAPAPASPEAPIAP